MKFALTRTTAKFGIANLRDEKNVGHAFDLPFSITVPASILLMLAPMQIDQPKNESPEGQNDIDPDKSIQPKQKPKLSAAEKKDLIIEQLFSKEGYVKRPALSPISINRKPEGVTVKIYDNEDFSDPLVLVPCRFKSLSCELRSPFQVVLTGKIQHPKYNNNELIRINSIMGKSFDIEWQIEQTDLFDSKNEEEETKDSKKKTASKKTASKKSPAKRKAKKKAAKAKKKTG